MTASTAIEAVISLGHELAEMKNAAHDLWSWLPSHKRAQAAHGDYASNFTPSMRDIMREASEYIAHGCRPTPEQQTHAGDLYRCPCGEDHEHHYEGSAEALKHGAWPMAPSGEIGAWAHGEDPTRVISASQKAQAEGDGGASASSVAPYSVPLERSAR